MSTQAIRSDLYQEYVRQSAMYGTAGSSIDMNSITMENGLFVARESDGDVFTITQSGKVTLQENSRNTTLDDIIKRAELQDGETINRTSNALNSTGSSSASSSVATLEAEIEALTATKDQNTEEIENLNTLIEDLKAEIKKEIEEAIEESKSITEEQKQLAQEVVNQELNKYTDANGEMSLEQFQANVASSLGQVNSQGNNNLISVTSKLLAAEGQLNTLDGYVAQMGNLISENAKIDKLIDTKETQLDAAKEAEAAAAAASKCDPIGFYSGDKRYDFFVDKDQDGLLSNANEFLGAENNWSEMTALDTNNDGKVNSDELAAANVKVVVTGSNGRSNVKDIKDLFNNTDAIDLSSYVAKNTDIGEGNTLLGTFGLTFKGEQISDGYNTLDTIEWLNANYDFSDGAAGENESAEQIQLHKQEILELKEKLNEAWLTIGIDRTAIAAAIATNEADAKLQGKEIEENMEDTDYSDIAGKVKKQLEKILDEKSQQEGSSQTLTTSDLEKLLDTDTTWNDRNQTLTVNDLKRILDIDITWNNRNQTESDPTIW